MHINKIQIHNLIEVERLCTPTRIIHSALCSYVSAFFVNSTNNKHAIVKSPRISFALLSYI